MKPFFTPAKNLVHAYEEYQRLSLGAGPPPSEFFQGVMVTTTHLGYEKKARVKGFGRSADQTVLESSEFGKVSVSVFFQKSMFYRFLSSLALINVRYTRIWDPVEEFSSSRGQCWAPGDPCYGCLDTDGTLFYQTGSGVPRQAYLRRCGTDVRSLFYHTIRKFAINHTPRSSRPWVYWPAWRTFHFQRYRREKHDSCSCSCSRPATSPIRI